MENALLKDAIDTLGDHLGNQGCNDLKLRDTPEARRLWDACQAHNYHITVEQVKSHPNYDNPLPYKDHITVFDTLLTYLLRKNLGLL